MTLQFRKERQRECRAVPDFALHRNYAALSFDDRLGKGQPQPDPLCIQGMFAAIKAFENMVNIFRGYAVSIITNTFKSIPPCKKEKALIILNLKMASAC